MTAGLLLDALAAQIELGAGQGDDVEGIHDRGRVGQDLGRGGLVAAEPVHGHDLDLVTEAGGLVGQPALQRCRRASGDQVEQPRPAGAVQHRGQVDDDRDVAVLAGSAGV